MIISVSNQKGGVGKTTISLNLAVALLRLGHTVQLWDLNEDQANLTSYAARCNVPCRQTSGATLKTDLENIQADYHILDCSPRAESTVFFAYEQSDMVIVPVQCEQFAVDGVIALMGTLSPIIRTKPHFDVRILISMYSSPYKEYRDKLRGIKDVRQFKTIIPRLAVFPFAQGAGVSIFDYEGGERGARVFAAIAKEIL